MPAAAPGAQPAVRLDGVSKAFGTNRAVDDVSVVGDVGTVTAIVGQNGAGKSTLMKLLAGVVQPDGGEIVIDGVARRFGGPLDAVRAGVGMVYQETALVGELTVWENVVLGWEPTERFGRLRPSEGRRRVLQLMAEAHLEVPVDRTVDALPVNLQQQVEILKVLFRGCRVIILDEPTSVLTPQQRDGLFDAVRRLRAAGKVIFFISHKLDEVIDISDHIYVMREGRLVTSTPKEGVDAATLATLIIGRELPPVTRGVAVAADATAVLEVTALRCRAEHTGSGLHGGSCVVNAGEVVGLAGVAGSGQRELMLAAAGLHPVEHGEVRFNGATTVTVGAGDEAAQTVLALRRAGMAYIPSDRNTVGTLGTEPLWVSALPRERSDLGSTRVFGRFGWLDRKAARRHAAELIADGGVVAPGPDARPGELSGGNLQKFIVQRELAGAPRLLLAEEPTRGIDIGAARAIRGKLRALAVSGSAVVIASADLDELIETCDRVLVLFNGRIVLDAPVGELTVERLGAAMTGLGDSATGWSAPTVEERP